MNKIKLVLVSTSFIATSAHAEVIFNCLTAQKERLILKDDGKVLSYQLGKPLQELTTVIQVPRSIARTEQWDGIGRWHDYHVLFTDEKQAIYVF